MVGWWHAWSKFRVLPWPGGLRDQPYFVYHAIEACSDAKTEIQIDRATHEKHIGAMSHG